MENDGKKISNEPRGQDLGAPEDSIKYLTDEDKQFIEEELDGIPADVDRVGLSALLRPVLEKLAGTNEAECEEYLVHKIGHRFELNSEDVKAYRKTVNGLRKERKRSRTGRTSKSRRNEVPTAKLPNLVDICEDKGEPTFLIKEGDTLSQKREVEIDGVKYVPPAKDVMPWVLPRADEAINHYEERRLLGDEMTNGRLFEDLVDHHARVSVLPNEDYYYLVASWVFHTYFITAFGHTPILYFYAVAERGKSRTGKGVTYVAYRGFRTEQLREAYIFRVADAYNATMFLDVMDIRKKADQQQCIDILLGRFDTGSVVPRVDPDKRPCEDIKYYEIFGATVLASNVPANQILESRCIPINMPAANVQYDEVLRPEDCLSIKERLVAFRGRYLDEPLPKIPNPMEGRLGDITQPLVQMIKLAKPEYEQKLLTLIQDIKEERRQNKASTPEGEILVAVMENEPKVVGGILPIKTITDTINQEKHERYKVSCATVGRRVKAMGFSRRRTRNGASAIYYDDVLVRRLALEHGLDDLLESEEVHDSVGTDEDSPVGDGVIDPSDGSDG